jgi:DNA polymerase-3 subunit epsilon
MRINLKKSLVFFDLETTGLNIAKDKIIEIGLLKLHPDGTEEPRRYLINPGIHIPEELSQIHGIYDHDVKDQPHFEEIADELNEFLRDCDLAGYNSIRYDLPLLVEEFLRCGKKFDMRNRRHIDVQNIYHKMEPRNLRAAYRCYCGKDLDEAHHASADTNATYEVLLAQLDKYENVEYEHKDGKKTIPVKNDVEVLSNFSSDTRFVDLAGHIVFNDKDEEVFNFGKHKGKAVEYVFKVEPSYYAWMMNADFPLYTKEIITLIKERMF